MLLSSLEAVTNTVQYNLHNDQMATQYMNMQVHAISSMLMHCFVLRSEIMQELLYKLEPRLHSSDKTDAWGKELHIAQGLSLTPPETQLILNMII